MAGGSEVWVVPGSPLPGGAGWKVWYSWAGAPDAFRPAEPTVLLRGQPQHVTTVWRPEPAYEGLERQVGVLEVVIDPVAPGEAYDVIVPETPMRQYRWRTLPDRIDGGVSFILSSCFWLPGDKDGHYAAGVRQVTKIEQPAFKLLIGDQVYQDWPLNLVPLDDPVTRFARRYDEYWGHPAYQEVLASSPNFFTCDDHEYWNGYPERMLYLPYTLTQGQRDRNGEVARALMHRYQTVLNPQPRAWFDFSVPPVSFFVTDSRSDRSRKSSSDPHFLLEDQWAALEQWAAGLRGPGVLVLGQPLFGKKGDWKEPALRDFEDDFDRLCAVFETATRVDTPHDVLVLTGDIHRARHFTATVSGEGTASVHELVSSAASRISGLKEPDIEDKSLRFSAGRSGRTRTWIAAPVPVQPRVKLPSADNNVALVRMSPGTYSVETGQQRVRFSIEGWSLRPAEKIWSRLLPRKRPPASLVRLYQTELELR